MKMPRSRVLLMLSLATLCAPAFGANPAGPGTVNYVEGSVDLAGKPLTSLSIGTATLSAGQTISTGNGKAEVLLTPGVYLRMDDNSVVKMTSTDLDYTVADLEQGRATVEVDEIHPQNNIQIVDHGVPTELLKSGLYEFDAANGEAMVFNGKEAARENDSKWVVVKGNHELALTSGELGKPQQFNAKANEDELYNWSSLRSGYLAEANSQIAGDYANMSSFQPGWFWDPYMLGYTFIGMDPFFSPFGFGYGGFGGFGFGGYGFGGYGYGGYGGYGYGRGYGGRGYAGRGGGLRSGVGGGGGFHGGGGGGFHGGGGGGGGHR